MALARRESQSIAVAIIDIDHFKSVNDRFGHAAGDAALRVFAERLLKTLRAADILCRYGGEEFALLMPSSLPGPALAAIERLRVAATMESIPWEGGALEIRASAGVFSAVPQAADSLDHFLDAADAALYEAKAAGRGRTAIAPS